ncbi:MAG: hypothetical protein GKR99_16475 [Rhodobacteraceae bacterium]|nr:hypothetical protein [Paracoccaceae bacterium]
MEVTAVIREMAVRLAKGRNNLRHLKPEYTIRVCKRCTMAVRVTFVPFGRVCPYLDALTRKQSPIARATHGAGHPETTATDPVHDWRTRNVVVISAAH